MEYRRRASITAQDEVAGLDEIRPEIATVTAFRDAGRNVARVLGQGANATPCWSDNHLICVPLMDLIYELRVVSFCCCFYCDDVDENDMNDTVMLLDGDDDDCCYQVFLNRHFQVCSDYSEASFRAYDCFDYHQNYCHYYGCCHADVVNVVLVVVVVVSGIFGCWWHWR